MSGLTEDSDWNSLVYCDAESSYDDCISHDPAMFNDGEEDTAAVGIGEAAFEPFRSDRTRESYSMLGLVDPECTTGRDGSDGDTVRLRFLGCIGS